MLSTARILKQIIREIDSSKGGRENAGIHKKTGRRP
jgi:hypothetical protein